MVIVLSAVDHRNDVPYAFQVGEQQLPVSARSLGDQFRSRVLAAVGSCLVDGTEAARVPYGIANDPLLVQFEFHAYAPRHHRLL